MRQIKPLLLFCLFAFTLLPAASQEVQRTVVKGVVYDSITSEPLPYVALQVEGTSTGAMSDLDGKFEFESRVQGTVLVISSLGYSSQKINIERGKVNKLRINLAPSAIQINEVVVRRGREKYDRKNPAVMLIEQVIAKKKQNQPQHEEYYECEHYEKTTFSINGIGEKSRDSWWGKKIPFVFDYLDTSEVTGKAVLAVSVREKLEQIYYRKTPEATWRVVEGTKSVGIDDFLDDDGMRQFIKNVFAEVNIFDNDIKLLQTRFPSPLSSTLATTFYKYYLEDTVTVAGKECIHVSFAPFNPESYGFTGHLYIVNDSTLAIQRAKLNIPKVININYVESLVITQDFQESREGVYYVKRNDVTIEMGLYGSQKGVLVSRIDTYNNYKFNEPRIEIYKNSERVIMAGTVADRADEFWQERRHIPLKEKEDAINALIDKLREVPVIGATIFLAEMLISGYIETNKDSEKSKFDFGPMNTTFSYNTVEGPRLRVGGMTTANLFPHLYLGGYAAYGFNDGKFKYNGEATYSFNDKKYFYGEFPIHSLTASYQYDTQQPGAEFLFTNKDNIFVSFKVRSQNYMTYDRRAKLTYHLEKKNGFSIKAWAMNLHQTPAGDLKFDVKDPVTSEIKPLRELTFTEVGTRLRFAPGEQFAQTKRDRYNMEQSVPIFTLDYKYGMKGLLGGDFEYHRTEFSFQKRWWLSMFGYINTFAQIGKVWNPVPFTVLGTPNANLSITIQPESYNLLDAMEFLNDEWIQYQVEYHLNGLILNRIPIIKYLKLRELVGVKGYFGRLSDKNNPAINTALPLFPRDRGGEDITVPMEHGPYWEMNVGLENILNVIRVDYVWRLNYLNNARALSSGLRVALYFKF